MSRYFPTYNTCYLKKIKCIQSVERYFNGSCYPKELIRLRQRAEQCSKEYQKKEDVSPSVSDQIYNAERLAEVGKKLLKAVETLESTERI